MEPWLHTPWSFRPAHQGSTCNLAAQTAQLFVLFHPCATICCFAPCCGYLDCQQKILYSIFQHFSHPYNSHHKLLPLTMNFYGRNFFACKNLMTDRNLNLVRAKIETTTSNGCYVATERSTELNRVLFCGGRTNEHDSVAGFRLALRAATWRLWRPYFKYMPRKCIYFELIIL